MLTSRTLVVFFLILMVFQPTYGCFQEDEKASELGNQDFDLLIFAQAWPATVCVAFKEIVTPSRNCFLPKNEEWIIHGIWPTHFRKNSPSYCNKTLHFNESALYPIVPQLKEKWRDLYGENSTLTIPLWRHEWEKHGTCAIVLQEFDTELKYFQKGLDLREEYDMTHILAKAGISPGGNYAVKDIIDGVQKIIKKTVQIYCVKNSKTQQSYLSDIKICLDKSLKLIDCNETYKFPTNCDRRMPVNYPRSFKAD